MKTTVSLTADTLQNYEALPVDLHHSFQAVIEIGHILLLIVQGYNDRISGHEPLIIREAHDLAMITEARGGVLLCFQRTAVRGTIPSPVRGRHEDDNCFSYCGSGRWICC